MKIFVAFLCILLIDEINGYKILMTNVLGSKSHLIPQLALSEGLIEKGHQVTFVVSQKYKFIPDSVELVHIAGIKEISSIVSKFNNASVLQKLNLVIGKVYEVCDLSTKDQKLIENLKSTKYDLVIISSFFQTCLLATVLHYQKDIPFIIYHPGIGIPSVVADVSGISISDNSYIPFPMIGATEKMNFFQRTKNFLVRNLIAYYMQSVNGMMDKLVTKNLGSDYDLLNIQKNASFMFINANFEYDYPFPITPDVIMTGCMQCRSGKILPKNLQTFMEKYKDTGVIVFSLGSVLSEDMINKQVIESFKTAFSLVPYGVIWQCNLKPEEVSGNVLIQKWLPMQDLFAHPTVKLVISHGGYMSFQEIIYHGVPYLGYPIGSTGDRVRNALLAEDRGIGLYLKESVITPTVIVDKIQKLLTDKSYEKNVKRLSKLLKSRIMNQRDEAIFWVEYAIKFKGLTHFKSHARYVSTLAYYSIDVIAFLFFVLIMSLYVFLLAVRIISYIFRLCFTKKKLKTN